MKRLLFLILAIHCSTLLFSQGICNLHRYRDTVFHNVSITTGVYFGTALPYGLFAQPQDLYMDIYAPANDTLRNRPLIVFQFGGGFTIGWRTEPVIPQFCEYFAKCGYVVATIDYRIGLNPLDTTSTVRAFYRGWQDERSAIRFLCKNAGPYKIDTASIFLTGTSAGCFCALANGFMTNADRPLSSYGTALEPTDLGCIDCSGNNDFDMHIPHIKGIINQWGAIMDTSLIEASDNVPVISFHGDQDILVPYEFGYPFQVPVFPKVYGSKPIHEQLNKVGILNEFHPLVGYGHEPELLAPHLNDTIYNYSRAFLYRILKPVTPAISGPVSACTNTTVSYSVANTAGSKYCWQLIGNGQIIEDKGNLVTVEWGDTGNVSVSVKELSYLDAEGDTRTFSTHVVNRVEASFSNVNNQLNVVFTNLSTNQTTWQWSFGDNTFSADTNPDKTYASRGVYDVTLVADNGVCADTFANSITVTLCPVAGFTHDESGLKVQLSNTSIYSDSFYWDFGDGTLSSDTNPAKLYAGSGTYTIKLISDNGFCTDSSTAIITIDSCPVPNFTYTITNNNCFFYTDTTNTLSYSWNFGDGDSATVNALNIFHQYKQSGIYTVTLKVKNSLGCEAIDTAMLLIEIPTGIDVLSGSVVSIVCNDMSGCLLQVAEGKSAQVEVFDITGRLVEKTSFTANYLIPTTGYTKGIYFLRIESNGEMLVKRFVKR